MSESLPSSGANPAALPILIIDHHAEVGDIVRDILIGEGFTATSAHDLDAAIQLLSSVQYGLVIANYMESVYRRGDQWPILEMIKALAGPQTPVIVLSASPNAQQQGAQGLGVADVIVKPFELADLVQRVKNAAARTQ